MIRKVTFSSACRHGKLRRLGGHSGEAREGRLDELLNIGIGLILAVVSVGATGNDRWADLIEQANRMSVAGRLHQVEEYLVQAYTKLRVFHRTTPVCR